MKVIKIGAVWCQTCLIMKPRWAKIEKQNPWLQNEFYDFDQDADKIKSLSVEAEKLPIFIFLDKNNQELFRKFGELSEKQIQELLDQNKEK